MLKPDHREARQVANSRPVRSHGRPRRSNQYIRIAHQLAHLERTRWDGLDRKRQIEVAAFHRINEVVVVRRLGELHVDVRPSLLEAAHHLGQHLVGDALIDADAQRTRPARRVRAKVRFGRPQSRLDRLRVAQQYAAGLRQRDGPPAPRPLDQTLSDEHLQGRHVIADRGQRAVQLLRRGPERPGLGDGPERSQMLDLDALPIVRHSDILRVKLMLLRRFTRGRLGSWRFSWRTCSSAFSRCWRCAGASTRVLWTRSARLAGGLRLLKTEPCRHRGRSQSALQTKMRWLAPGAVAMLLAAGCGGQSNGPSAATTINFWYLTNGAPAAATAFHAAHPDIDVKATRIADLPALNGANAPDVVELNRDWVAAVANTGVLHEFSIDEGQSIGGKRAFVPPAWPTGKTTSIPWFIDTRGVYYRADILKELNIDPANAFSNWEAFDHTLDAIKISKKISPLGIAGRNDSNPVASFAPWIWEAGGSLLSDDGTKPTINQSASVDGADEYQRFGGRYVDANVLKQDTAGVESMFANGKFAVTIAGPSLATKLKGSQFGVQQFPPGHTGHAVWIGGSNLAIVKNSNQESAAFELVKWLTGSEGQSSLATRIGMYPALVAAGQPGPIKSQLAAGRSLPALTAWPALDKSMRTDLGKIWDEVIAEGQPVAKDLLQTLLDKTAADMQTALGQT